MRYDTIIIGGGLSGLVCVIRLQKAGQKCCIVSSGQSALHFSSGCFDFLDRLEDGTVPGNLAECLVSLPESHPYSKIGAETAKKYMGEVPEFFAGCGVRLCGNPYRNSYRMTPMGDMCPTWLSLEDFPLAGEPDAKVADRALVVNIFGYLDFNTAFVADALERNGTVCRVISVRIDEMERLRRNPSEMRATNIARVMDRPEVCGKFIAAVSEELRDEDTIILPAVFGLASDEVLPKIRSSFSADVRFVATMPPSVPGIRTQMKLRKAFEHAGGVYLLGDTVNGAEMSGDKVLSISTSNFGDYRLHADNYVLASGSFFSKGLVAVPDKIYEPVFGLDVDYAGDRKEWYDTDLFSPQNYISFGVATSRDFRPFKDGKPVSNLYAVGSVLSGTNALNEGSGAGTAILTAFRTADLILGRGDSSKAGQSLK